ncbi:unnamed protein product [Boreogadus saida]
MYVRFGLRAERDQRAAGILDTNTTTTPYTTTNTPYTTTNTPTSTTTSTNTTTRSDGSHRVSGTDSLPEDRCAHTAEQQRDAGRGRTGPREDQADRAAGRGRTRPTGPREGRALWSPSAAVL